MKNPTVPQNHLIPEVTTASHLCHIPLGYWTVFLGWKAKLSYWGDRSNFTARSPSATSPDQVSTLESSTGKKGKEHKRCRMGTFPATWALLPPHTTSGSASVQHLVRNTEIPGRKGTRTAPMATNSCSGQHPHFQTHWSENKPARASTGWPAQPSSFSKCFKTEQL